MPTSERATNSKRPQDFPTVYPLGIYNLSLLVNSPSSVPPCEYDQSVLV